MKSIIYIFLISCLGSSLFAQDSLKKPSTLVFHVFYNDFNTPVRIRAHSLGYVIDHKLWSNLGEMQMGFGFSYLKGITTHIDFVSDLDGSATDYHFKDGTTYGANKLLLDANAGVNIKLLTDKHTVLPYVWAGAGASLYQGKSGFYIPVGAGLQFNIFNQAYVITNTQYRRAVSANVNDHFQYSIGIGTTIGKKKRSTLPISPLVIAVITKRDTAPAIVIIPVKNIAVTVTDEQTGLPLPGVAVSITGTDGTLIATSDANGRANFSMKKAGDYTISGVLNGITTNMQHLAKNNFDTDADAININLKHNDPRFTLNGIVNNKRTGAPEADVTVSVINITKNSDAETQSRQSDGSFSVQLDAGSDFTISGKKASYISNIEKASTTGLNRSATLYVKLELGIEQVLPDKTITLSNIYYDTGSFKIKAAASSDLEKLVKFLMDNPSLKIEIASHTDSRGSAKRNLILSQQRAQEVVNYLQKQGINKNRLIPKGYGETRLVNGCVKGVKCTDEQNAQNRRTEFKVVGD